MGSSKSLTQAEGSSVRSLKDLDSGTVVGSASPAAGSSRAVVQVHSSRSVGELKFGASARTVVQASSSSRMLEDPSAVLPAGASSRSVVHSDVGGSELSEASEVHAPEEEAAALAAAEADAARTQAAAEEAAAFSSEALEP